MLLPSSLKPSYPDVIVTLHYNVPILDDARMDVAITRDRVKKSEYGSVTLCHPL